jgi:hypothetical protein
MSARNETKHNEMKRSDMAWHGSRMLDHLTMTVDLM